MTYTAANDLLELLHWHFNGRTLILSKTTEETVKILKKLDIESNFQFNEGVIVPLKESYCQKIVGGLQPLMIKDTHHHPFARKLAITHVANVRSYLGVPIFYKNGDLFGTLSVIHTKPIDFTEKELELLQRHANLFSYVVELEKKVNHDFMTGIYNRSYLYDNFQDFGSGGTFMLLDLDGFKAVNDVYGHDIGDDVIIEVAKRVKKYLSPDGLCFRIGGDEFVLILPQLLELEKIKVKCENLLDSLSSWQNFSCDINVSVSIGVVRYPIDADHLKDILKKADQAMYQAKVKGKNAYQFYSNEMLE